MGQIHHDRSHRRQGHRNATPTLETAQAKLIISTYEAYQSPLVTHVIFSSTSDPTDLTEPAPSTRLSVYERQFLETGKGIERIRMT